MEMEDRTIRQNSTDIRPLLANPTPPSSLKAGAPIGATDFDTIHWIF
jgi:hypothetical protein